MSEHADPLTCYECGREVGQSWRGCEACEPEDPVGNVAMKMAKRVIAKMREWKPALKIDFDVVRDCPPDSPYFIRFDLIEVFGNVMAVTFPAPILPSDQMDNFLYWENNLVAMLQGLIEARIR